jgi:hypothetical protein
MVGLGSAAADALARILPVLACGEESAIHVFSSASQASFARGAPSAGKTMLAIARDEEVHSDIIEALRGLLPACSEREQLRLEARGFYLRLASSDPRLHFLRIRELDSAVCLILGALLQSGTALARAPRLREIAARIRSDEARHVRLTRRYLSAAELPMHADDEVERVRVSLIRLLDRIGGAFQDLGADPDRLFLRIRSRARLTGGESRGEFGPGFH